ncbi:hypothetical protein DICPUDRAFT_83755 [Dictyostelium purpureum]|uniref:Uncharacterized protein n=1 Tax=Dictyostelium purpureum TaxID=5786 RepID=F1A0I7_DICPU|nr:uncharacterized protein DICPUDRAFT_83755 [Dictyostelium purpureum]EGC30303.1 hypothetical protein DICPUDRAFT_83755 [Dictyostelium purpureum]|eukprot:XP_003293182.1 hypothetical protein DICPUDRAFT_83755 [Dictyostelium purpureum]
MTPEALAVLVVTNPAHPVVIEQLTSQKKDEAEKEKEKQILTINSVNRAPFKFKENSSFTEKSDHNQKERNNHHHHLITQINHQKQEDLNTVLKEKKKLPSILNNDNETPSFKLNLPITEKSNHHQNDTTTVLKEKEQPS